MSALAREQPSASHIGYATIHDLHKTQIGEVRVNLFSETSWHTHKHTHHASKCPLPHCALIKKRAVKQMSTDNEIHLSQIR